MKRGALVLAALLLVGCGRARPAAQWTERHVCVRVIDGDTIEIEGGRHVRLANVEAFEIRRGQRIEAQARAAGISVEEALRRGRAEAEELRRRIEGKEIELRFRLYPTDRYGRLLAEWVDGD